MQSAISEQPIQSGAHCIMMRAIFAFLFALCISSDAPSWPVHGKAPTADVVCNFVTGVATGVGAGTCIASPTACDGVTDNTTAFDAFVSWAINTWQITHTGLIELFIPSGSNCSLTTFDVTFSGIKKLLVNGYGAALSGTYFHLGGSGQYQDGSHSTRIVTTSMGATQTTFNLASTSQPTACNSNATCAALFTVGGWAFISGIDLQTGVGFPSNPFYFQYVQVTNINPSTGVVTFTPPLTDAYKSTWPSYNSGGFLVPDGGGPATLYVLNPGWDIEIEWRGITFTSNNQIDAPGRRVIFRDVTFTANGVACIYPTVNKYFSIINATMTNCTMEADKIVEEMTLSNVAISQIVFQNSGIKKFTANNLTAIGINGTPLVTEISNSTITSSLIPGPTTNGRTNSIYLLNTSIASFDDGVVGGIIYSGRTSEGLNHIAGLSMSGGIITIPNSYIQAATEQLGWAAPGGNYCWIDDNDNSTCDQLFQITDMTQDVTNTYIHTSQAGGFPAFLVGKLGIRTHPAPQFTCSGCSGSPDAVGLNSAPAGAPLYSYSKRTYVNSNTVAPIYTTIWGTLSKLNVTVNIAYTGSPAATSSPNTLFHQWMTTAPSLVTYVPAIVNLKVAGLRALDATSGYPATWSGTQSGDMLTTNTQALWANTAFIAGLTDVSGDPSNPMSVTVEMTTSQGVVLPYLLKRDVFPEADNDNTPMWLNQVA